jgi:amidohydrolase
LPPHGYDGYLRRSAEAAGRVPADDLDEQSAFSGAPTQIRDRLAARIDELAADLHSLAKQLYEAPELAFAETRSVSAVAGVLADHGITAEVGAFGLPTALLARAGEASGPQLAVLAEYDALPGIGHACGHNLIAATGVGAFLALASVIGELGGGVRLIGTPAEEGGGGKQLIIDAGGFAGVDAAMMVHPGNVNRAFGRGLGLRRVEVVFHGRAAHAAGAPYLGRNALDGAVAGYQAVAMLRQHILPTDRIHGIITEGGTAPNVVPNRAAAQFFVRSADRDTLDLLVDRVVDALRGAATATGTQAEIVLDSSPAYQPMRQNDPLATRFVANLRGRRIFNPRRTASIGGGSTDMGNVSQLIPAIHPNVQVSPSGVATHTAAFAPWTVTEQGRVGTLDGALGLALTGADYLADADLRAAVAADFAGGSAAPHQAVPAPSFTGSSPFHPPAAIE